MLAVKKYKYSGLLKQHLLYSSQNLDNLRNITFPTAYNAVNSNEWANSKK